MNMQTDKNRFLYGNLSDVGRVRDENQDYYGRYSGRFGDLLLICDGMGGYQGGSIASRMAVDIISEHFKMLSFHYDVKYEIEQAANQAQMQIKRHQAENPDTKSMGTTLVLLLIRGDSYWFAHIGDSRIYLKRDGRTNQLTKDHSLVQEMIDSGIIEPEQAHDHPKRNIITRALGTDNHTVDIKGPYHLKTGDVFMLCSDGMYEYFDHEEISEHMDKEPQNACELFVALANQRGGKDNITVQVVKIIGEILEPVIPTTAPPTKNKLLNKRNAIIALFIIILSGLLATTTLHRCCNKEEKKQEEGKPKTESNEGQINSKGKAKEEDKGDDKDKKEAPDFFEEVKQKKGDGLEKQKNKDRSSSESDSTGGNTSSPGSQDSTQTSFKNKAKGKK